MNKEKEMENRTQDKKAFGKFIAIIIISAIGGGFLGILSVKAAKGVDDVAAVFYRIGSVIAPFGNIALTTVILIVVAVMVGRARKMFQAWDGEDEEAADRIDIKLTYALTVVGVNNIMSFFLFAAGIYVLSDLGDDPYNLPKAVKLAAAFIGLFYAMLVNTLFQKIIVNLTKELNPEKQGSIYDVKFQKTWFASCDEAERMQVFMSSYKAYMTGTYTCLILWMICFAGMLVWDWGMMPITMVMIVWLSMTLSYSREAIRLSKNPKELMR